jgi:hypothetical protein
MNSYYYAARVFSQGLIIMLLGRSRNMELTLEKLVGGGLTVWNIKRALSVVLSLQTFNIDSLTDVEETGIV